MVEINENLRHLHIDNKGKWPSELKVTWDNMEKVYMKCDKSVKNEKGVNRWLRFSFIVVVIIAGQMPTLCGLMYISLCNLYSCVMKATLKLEKPSDLLKVTLAESGEARIQTHMV